MVFYLPKPEDNKDIPKVIENQDVRIPKPTDMDRFSG